MPKYHQNLPHCNGLGKRILRLFDRMWPGVCCICAHTAPAAEDLCVTCRNHFPYLDYEAAPESAASRFMTLCIACGVPLPVGLNHCHGCVSKPSPYASMLVPFRYAHPVDQMITRLKYGGQLSYGRVLGALLAAESARPGAIRRQPAGLAEAQVDAAQRPDALLPMPMHPARYRQRGFNQAHEIAHWCGLRAGIAVCSEWACRQVDTQALAGLNKASRELEIRGAFQADASVSGKHIAIIDDVLTTGASSAELARELYDTGARAVSLWVLARTASAYLDQAEFINRRLSEAGRAASSKLPCPDTASDN